MPATGQTHLWVRTAYHRLLGWSAPLSGWQFCLLQVRSSTSFCSWSHDLVAIQLPEHTEEERFPGMTITILFQMVEKVAERTDKAQIITKARAHKLLTSASGACTGLIYEKGGKDVTQKGPVILCSGGFGADFTQNSLLAQYRPDLCTSPQPMASIAQAMVSRWVKRSEARASTSIGYRCTPQVW